MGTRHGCCCHLTSLPWCRRLLSQGHWQGPTQSCRCHSRCRSACLGATAAPHGAPSPPLAWLSPMHTPVRHPAKLLDLISQVVIAKRCQFLLCEKRSSLGCANCRGTKLNVLAPQVRKQAYLFLGQICLFCIIRSCSCFAIRDSRQCKRRPFLGLSGGAL